MWIVESLFNTIKFAVTGITLCASLDSVTEWDFNLGSLDHEEDRRR